MKTNRLQQKYTKEVEVRRNDELTKQARQVHTLIGTLISHKIGKYTICNYNIMYQSVEKMGFY